MTRHYFEGPPRSVRSGQDFRPAVREEWSDIGRRLLADEDGAAYGGRGAGPGAVCTPHHGPRPTDHGAPGNRWTCHIGRDGTAATARRTIVAPHDVARRRSGRALARKGHRDIDRTS